jgi:hypothetical protein
MIKPAHHVYNNEFTPMLCPFLHMAYNIEEAWRIKDACEGDWRGWSPLRQSRISIQILAQEIWQYCTHHTEKGNPKIHLLAFDTAVLLGNIKDSLQ